MRLQAEADQAGVLHVVVVLGLLDPRVLQVLDLDRAGEALGDLVRDLADRVALGHLVEDTELTGVGRVLHREPDALDRVPDVEQPPGLPAGAVHRQRLAEHGLDDEPVEHGAEHGVVVEPRRQPRVLHGLRRLLPVDHALVEVGDPQAPDPAAELEVVRIVHLAQVVERARLLRVEHPVLAPVVLDLQPAFLDVDVRRAVLAHRAELDQVDVRVRLGDGVHQVQRADHVVVLGVDRVRPVDHRVRRCPLLGEVHDRVRLELPQHPVDEVGVEQVTGVRRDPPAGDFLPGRDPGVEVLDRDQALHPQLAVVAPTGEVVEDGRVVAAV